MIMMSSAENELLVLAKETLLSLGYTYYVETSDYGKSRTVRWEKPKLNHDLYTDADKDRPSVICDSNGQVVLDLCKRCNRGESELTDHPECTPRGEVLGGPDGVSWPDDLKTFDERAAYQRGVADARALAKETPIDMVLYCPACGTQHIDKDNCDEIRIMAAELGIDREGDRAYSDWLEENEWTNPPHRSHLCHNPKCKTIWRPADVPTNGVATIGTKGKADSWHGLTDAMPTRAVDFKVSLPEGDTRKATVMWSLTTGNKVELGIKVEGISPEVIKALDRMTPTQPWSRGHSINYPLRAAAIINAAIGHGPMTPREQFDMTVEQALQGEHGVVAKELAAALSGGVVK